MVLIQYSPSRFPRRAAGAAKTQGYIFKDQTLPVVLYPKEYETYWTDKQEPISSSGR